MVLKREDTLLNQIFNAFTVTKTLQIVVKWVTSILKDSVSKDRMRSIHQRKLLFSLDNKNLAIKIRAEISITHRASLKVTLTTTKCT